MRLMMFPRSGLWSVLILDQLLMDSQIMISCATTKSQRYHSGLSDWSSKTLISGETHPAMVTRVRITGRLMLSECWGFKIRNNVKAAWGNAKSQMRLEENIQLPKIA